MKIIKKLCRLMVAALACAYAFCLINGISPIEYTATPVGGELSLAGYSMEITMPAANTFWRVYTAVEDQASEIIPSKLRSAVRWISSRLPA